MEKAKLAIDWDTAEQGRDVCGELMVDNLHKGMDADWHCQKHRKNLPKSAMMFCFTQGRNGMCWVDSNETNG